MNPASSISSTGQVIIPPEVRLRLGLQEGDRVEFVAEGERTLIRQSRQVHNLSATGDCSSGRPLLRRRSTALWRNAAS